MFHSTEMSLILLSKLFIFLENFLPLCFCYLKLLVAVKLKQTQTSVRRAYRKRQTVKEINPMMFPVPMLNWCFLSLCPTLGCWHSERHLAKRCSASFMETKKFKAGPLLSSHLCMRHSCCSLGCPNKAFTNRTCS